MDKTTLAYLAGALDADGYFSIKRDSRGVRIYGDRVNAVFKERIGLKQVTPQVPELLRATFGGSLSLRPASTKLGRPLYGWEANDRIAADAALALLPFLRIKRQQAETLLELRRLRKDKRVHQLAWWWERDHPDWRALPLLTASETARRMGYTGTTAVSQAVANGTILALPYGTRGKAVPRIPAALVDELVAARPSAVGPFVTPAPLIALYEGLWETVRQLNAIGISDHPITLRRGPYAPILI